MKIKVELFTEGATKPLALLAEKIEDVELIPRNLEKTVKIGSGLGEPLRAGLIKTSFKHMLIFLLGFLGTCHVFTSQWRCII